MLGVFVGPLPLILAGAVCPWVWPLVLRWSTRRVPSFTADFAIGAAVSSATLLAVAFTLDTRVTPWGPQAWLAVGLAAVGGTIAIVGTVVVATGLQLVGLARGALMAAAANLAATTALSLVMAPPAHPQRVFIGLALAVVSTAAAAGACARGSFRPGLTWRKPAIIAALGGALLAATPPYVARALGGPSHMAPLLVAGVFVAASALSSPGPIRYLMKRPLVGAAYQPGTLFSGTVATRAACGLSGALWGVGAAAAMSASTAASPLLAHGATWLAPLLVTAAGVGIWRELRDADRATRTLLVLATACYVMAAAAVLRSHEASVR